MKKFFVLLFIGITNLIFSNNTVYEPGFSLYSMKTLGKGNTNVANAYGLESFEYNPAGLRTEKELTLININASLISNIFKLKDDMTDIYNDYEESSADTFSLNHIMFFLQKKNIDATVDLFLSQVTDPSEGSTYANGFGITPLISTGVVGSGFGIGIAMGLDAEAYGTTITTSQFHSILSTSLLLGYAHTFDFKLFKLDVGATLRPMYNIRGIAPVSSVVSYIASESQQADFLKDIEYLTGYGIGADVGVKLRLMDLVAGLSVTDLFGTSVTYSGNSYDNIVSGVFLGSEEVNDTYITPMAINVGLAYNPDLRGVSSVFSPKISVDYKVDIETASEIENFDNNTEFFPNLSLGVDVELFSFINVRAGLNQGYMTIGAGFDILMLEINAAVYSWELGREPGDRQQMGAGVEFALRF